MSEVVKLVLGFTKVAKLAVNCSYSFATIAKMANVSTLALSSHKNSVIPQRYFCHNLDLSVKKIAKIALYFSATSAK